LWCRDYNRLEISAALGGIEGNGKDFFFLAPDNRSFRLDDKSRIFTFFRFDGLELKLEGVFLSVKTQIFGDIQGKIVRLFSIQILLIENSPVHFDFAHACVFDLETLGDVVRVGNLRGHGKGRRNSVVVYANLVGGNGDGRARNLDVDGEFNWRQTLDLRNEAV
jgi:hypothetical protein